MLRYTVRVQRELQLDEGAIRALREDRKRFLCKAVENYINCLLSGEEHDMWIFRLCSLWLENSGVYEVNVMIQVSLTVTLLHLCIQRYNFITSVYTFPLCSEVKYKVGEQIALDVYAWVHFSTCKI